MSSDEVKTREEMFMLQESLDSMFSCDLEMFICFALVVCSTLLEKLLFLIN